MVFMDTKSLYLGIFNRDLDVYCVIFVSVQILFAFDLVILFIWTSIWSFTDKH